MAKHDSSNHHISHPKDNTLDLQKEISDNTWYNVSRRPRNQLKLILSQKNRKLKNLENEADHRGQ